jgi:hypothetical protein
MSFLLIIELYRKKLAEFEEKEYKNIVGDKRVYLANLYFALALFEQAVINQTPISKENEFFFTGQYHVSRFLFDGEYEELSQMYYEIVNIVKSKKYFRGPDLKP